MGKKSRAKPRRDKPIARKPDEVIAEGPLRIERFGRFVRMVNLSTPEQHAEFLKRSAEYDRQVIQDLERAVPQLQEELARYDPVALMHRAAYVLLPLFMKYRSQHEFEPDETLFLPAVEYLQYLIARTAPRPEGREPSEEEWEVLWDKTIKVLQLTQQHLMYRKTLATPPTEMDELRFLLDGRRLMIRVNRYPLFLADYLRASLEPYDRELHELYGIGADEIVTGIGLIEQYQKSGVIERYRRVREVNESLMADLAAKGYSVHPGSTDEEVARTQAALMSDEFKERYEAAQEQLRLTFTAALFDITDLTALPKAVLSLLSVRPGESVLTTLTGPAPAYEDLSPLSESVLHYKPFLEVDGRYYTFYHSGFEDHIADIVESELFSKFPERVSEMAKRRSNRLETDAKDLLVSILEPEVVLQNVYYPNPDDPGNFAELDTIIIADDILLFVEAKAGGLSPAAVRGAPLSVAQELSDLIIEGQRQSERAERYLRSAAEVAFFDESGKNEVCRLRASQYRRVIRVVVTREDLGWVGAKIAMLSILDPNLSKSYPWHVSMDDLRVVAELFRGDGVRFAHYLEVRLKAAGADQLSQHDEVEHVGLYNKMNYYDESPVLGGNRMTYDASYILDIDHYFMERSAGDRPVVPTQEIPPRLRALIADLTRTRLPHRYAAGEAILSLDGAHRTELDTALGILAERLAQGRRSTIRMAIDGDAGITVTYAEDANWKEECLRSTVQMETAKRERWLVIQLDPAREGSVRQIEGLRAGTFSPEELRGVRARHEAAVEETLKRDKPGRNDPCPCGSGVKFKKCHGR